MSETAVKVELIGKKYSLAHKGRARDGLRHVLQDTLSMPWRALARGWRARETPKRKAQIAANSTEEFWALKDISFEIKRGEVVGVIGRNGAGKSTLLKILSRITEPTVGRIEIDGRVASLLEVGTGFHPELTGRENIFLNGTILGMKRMEIRAKFDEIVEFAEIEKFLDTPVKHYSTGMYVRLAFAVAAHLDPEILIVDEVLAVGDAQFQRKCLGKMKDVSQQQGRTVLFVSHNMSVVERLCNRSVLLHKGKLEYYGPTTMAIARYSKDTQTLNGKVLFLPQTSHSIQREVRILSIATVNSSGEVRSEFATGEPFSVIVEFDADISHAHGVIGCQIRTPQGVPLFTSHWNDVGPLKDIPLGSHTALCHIRDVGLMPGTYFVEVGIADRAIRVLDLKTDELTFQIIDKPGFGGVVIDKRPGYIFYPLKWTLMT